MSQLEYLKKITEVINKIGAEQTQNIEKAADICAEVIGSGKLVHLFGSGHSVLPVQDVFPRYGGLVGWHPCMDPRLMWSNAIGPGGARELLWIERQEGYIKNFLQSYNFQQGEALIVYSHGGLNAAPIEAAMYAKEHGLKVIAITSGENYKKAAPAHSSGKKLGDLADVLIDNCCPLEDALVEIPDYYQKVGASSTVAVITISQSIASETALRLQKMGHKMFIFVSPNVTEVPKDYMNEVYASYTETVFKNHNM
ncbi:MAG: SIS domain-containing protein [Firmicutes bacterium HGW-Firmicutes-16]|nr:MAG: SIS domain-containing protein [Firmicutes bacterium HGW-Firmicutes-16]